MAPTSRTTQLRCPACDVEVVTAHQCTTEWEDDELGTRGFETTVCEVVNGRLSVSISGGTDMSGVPVMGLGDDAVESWFHRDSGAAARE